MASPPPNLDTRELPRGWVQQYNWEYRQWFYVDTRQNPPRSSWEHPLGPIPQNFVPPLGPPPPDRSYNRSPYGAPPPQGYGGYSGYQPSYGQPPPRGYQHSPHGGYVNGPPYGSENRGYYPSQPQVVYVEEERKQQKKGLGSLGTGLLAGGAGLVGGALLMDAIEDHNEYEQEQGFDQGYDAGYDAGFDNGVDAGW